ncbi:MAG: PAS domain S-box protein [bacterium]
MQRYYLELLESLSHASAVALTATDMQGTIVFASAHTAALHGFPSPRDLIGRAASELLHFSEHERAAANTQRTLREGKIGSTLYKMVRRDGSVFPAELTAAVLRGQRAEPLGFVAQVRDVTARLREQEELRETRDRYRQLVELCPDPVVVLQDGMYRFVNEAFTEVFGYTRLDVEEGLSFYSLVQEKDLPAVRARYEARLAGEEVPQTFRTELLAKDGTAVFCETSAALIQHEGRPADLVVIRDIRERLQARRHLEARAAELARMNAALAEANARLERLHQQKDELIATVSHELRTPLVTGIGYLDLLLQGKLGHIPEEAASHVRVGRQNLLRLADLIDEILDYHALVNRRSDSREALVLLDLGALCRETVRDFRIRTACDADHIALELPDPCPTVSALSGMIRRVLDNLLNNAHHHGGARVKIRLSVAPVESGRVRVAVSDDGPGIPGPLQGRVFEPFVKAAEGGAGTGLGLAVVWRLLRLHDTEPRLRSDPGRGTEVSFELPVVDGVAPEVARSPEREAVPLQTLSGTILVVEDDADTRDFLELLLEGVGFEVTLAHSAEVGLDHVQADPPDLILVDMMLPGMDGVELCTRVKGAPATAATPVCMFTARADEQARARAVRAGCDAYLTKPIPPATLLSTIRDLLRRD